MGRAMRVLVGCEFSEAYERADDPVERARRLIIRSFMGFGSGAASSRKGTGFRSNSNRSGTTPAHDWTTYPDALSAVIERTRGVVIEHRDALAVMAIHDGPETLHYVDPPYLHGSRSAFAAGNYRHELTDEKHAELLDALKSLTGMVVLSGYPSPLYDAALAGWTRVDRAALADGARARVEVLWLNPAAAAGIASPQFFGAAP